MLAREYNSLTTTEKLSRVESAMTAKLEHGRVLRKILAKGKADRDAALLTTKGEANAEPPGLISIFWEHVYGWASPDFCLTLKGCVGLCLTLITEVCIIVGLCLTQLTHCLI